jgi:trigger factor
MNPECTQEVVIDLSAEEVSKVYSRVADNYKRYAKVPGFRPGKVTDAVVKSRFGKEIRKDVMDELLPTSFQKAVQEKGFQPVGQPQVVSFWLEDGQPMHMQMKFEVVPEFSIEGYKDVVVEKPKAELTDEEFQKEIQRLLDSHATFEPVEEDRAIVDGDFVEIGYSGKIEGSDIEPISGESAMVEVGSMQTVDGFNQVLRGAKVGQDLKTEIPYPEDYPEQKLAGKTTSYEIQVKSIKKRVTPELTDELAKEYEAENVAALEARIRESLLARKQRSAQFETQSKLFAALAEKFPFPVPEQMISNQIEVRLERGLRALSAQGLSPEHLRGLDFSRMRQAQRESAISDVKTVLLVDKIAEAEQITISDEELDRELEIAALQSNESLDALKTRLMQSGELANLRQQLRHDKAAQTLYDRLP